MTNMKVLCLPDFSRSNAYQSLLAEAIADVGVEVELDQGRGRFPVRSAARRHGWPHIIHLHWTHPFCVSPGIRTSIRRATQFIADLALLKASGTKVVWTIHNLVNHEQRQVRFELFCNCLIARLSDCLIVHYPDAVDIVRRKYRLPPRMPIAVIPHGHYIDGYPNVIGRGEARERLGLNPEDLGFLFFGAVRSYKGITALTSAFRDLENRQARLLIAGRPNTPAIGAEVMAQSVADDRIRACLEFIPDDQVQRFMNAADAVVLPSSNILTSGSAILAMSFGKAIIAADTPHLRYLLGDEGGILYDSTRVDGLHRALGEAASADLQAMGGRNLDAVGQYSWGQVAEETAKVYRQVLGGCTRG